MYEVLQDHPERRQRFANAMSLHARSPVFAVEHLASGYDWAALGSGIVVDVRGLPNDSILKTSSRADNIARSAVRKGPSHDILPHPSQD
jgi:hypothetical protein